ncbi:NAD(P)-dependent dehydrogenase (short-subunit alcohol dehydrogenase family) [Tepidimonas ignava]|uniref:NAD(P)-dependent dehydrogenase (Short-subunit alcohol dehydrogenase family) n=1 Tax=Tepidimonas ignava TaxID=114249 RepID=A0A4V6NZ87_9BURK|nr:SDR family NAD(P)-dependent oxidoreductase [Tepidimonas ignava]TCS94377.1 NAD(P)-dependent dehydrogenase (short-subunit alcohol dehydrogenase family) [Tepidimonas ignava]TSE19096.1 putative oxidoreductase [Tepidimonas ignava]
MQPLQGHTALVTGAGSGLGEATARLLAERGVRVAVIDLSAAAAQRVADELNHAHGAGTALALAADVADPAGLQAAFEQAAAALGPARILMHVAGIGTARRIIGKDGQPAPLEDFERVVRVNLIGSYNAARLFAAACAKLPALADGERGVMVLTASVAAFDGQVGQQAYSASKGGVVGMTLPMARDLAQHGIRVCTIAPGLFNTPLMRTLPEAVQQSLAASIPFPARLGKPEEFAELACHIVTNGHLNGEVIRLDGALRLPPR